MSRQTFLGDAPYEFVPLLERCERKKYAGHHIMERDTYTGRVKLKITIESSLHIGGLARDCDEDGNMVKKQMCKNGHIVIPGSSLKGAVRSIAEAVSYSCAVQLPFKQLRRALPPDNRYSCDKIEAGLCITCSMFGMAGRSGSYRGKVSFGEFELKGDGTVNKKIPILESPFKDYPENHDVFRKSGKEKSTYGNERLYYCRACEGDCQYCLKEDYDKNVEIAGRQREMRFRGRKFYNPDGEIPAESRKAGWYEFIRPKSVLSGEVMFQNLREEEGKLLAYALGIGHQFTMKLGYGKSLGYGRVRVDLTSVESISSRYPAEKPVNADMFIRWAEEYSSKSPAEIQSVIHEFERIMN